MVSKLVAPMKAAAPGALFTCTIMIVFTRKISCTYRHFFWPGRQQKNPQIWLGALQKTRLFNNNNYKTRLSKFRVTQTPFHRPLKKKAKKLPSQNPGGTYIERSCL